MNDIIERVRIAPIAERLALAAEKLANSVSFDMNGDLIGERFVGGHGGLISQATMVAADDVRRSVAAFRTTLQEGR